MRYFGFIVFVGTVAGSTQRLSDPCTAICDEFALDGLCGDFESHCMLKIVGNYFGLNKAVP
jgi:hypothetical protein